MKYAKIHLLADISCMVAFYSTRERALLASKLLARSCYSEPHHVHVDPWLDGEDAAEEMFDLTNNPSRQTDRLIKYGRHRSISVGDIVEVDGTRYLCCPEGWEPFTL